MKQIMHIIDEQLAEMRFDINSDKKMREILIKIISHPLLSNLVDEMNSNIISLIIKQIIESKLSITSEETITAFAEQVLYDIFLNALYNTNTELINSTFKQVISINNCERQNNIRYYLFIKSLAGVCFSTEIGQYVRDIHSVDDILSVGVDNKSKKENEIRTLIFDKKYNDAYDKLVACNGEFAYGTHNAIVYNSLNAIMAKENEILLAQDESPITCNSVIDIEGIVCEVLSNNRLLITGPFSEEDFNEKCHQLDKNQYVKYIGLVQGENKYSIIVIPYVMKPVNLSKPYLIGLVQDYFNTTYNNPNNSNFKIDEIIKYLLMLTYVDGMIRPQNLYSISRLYDKKGDAWSAYSAAYACYIANIEQETNFDCSRQLSRMDRKLRDSLAGKSIVKEDNTESELDNYGIYSIDIIRTMVNADYSNIDEVCESLQINKQEIGIVYMILARDCYINRSYYIGDLLINKAYIRAKNNRSQMCIWQFIKNNRDLYYIKYAIGKKPITVEKV